MPAPTAFYRTRAALFLALLFATSASFGQLTRMRTTAECGTDARHRNLLQTDPRYQQRMADFESMMQGHTAPSTRGGGPEVVPVVVHVMGAGTALTNITDAQVRSAILSLNQRFRKVPGTLGFGSGVDVGVEFALAARDPNGNCTNGITRYDLSGNADYVNYGMKLDGVSGVDELTVKALDTWDPLRYYNIWVVSEIDNNNGGSGTQGFAYYAAAHGQAYDGMVILCNNLKDPTRTTLVHELGHALNLYHTFEGDANGTACPTNGNCSTDGDQVCDTPPHIRSPSNCNSAGTNSCDGGSANTLFVYNYMEYSNCRDGFTNGQAARTGPALTTQRSSLLAVNGNMSLVPPTGANPLMDLVASATLLCGTGQSVTFYDHSTCIPNTFLESTAFPSISFAWSVTNGTVTYTSTSHNPTITLAQTGTYNATLTITTSVGTFTRTEQGIVLVSAAPISACAPTTTNAGNFAQTVSSVVFNTINNATSTINNVAYTDLSCSKNTVVATGGTYPLSITINAGGSAAESLNAYIDYNNNGTFEDPSELVATGSQPVSSSGTIVANVTIPGGAVQNTLLRMRIYGEAGTLLATERNCIAATFIGDVEDYGVYISNSLAAVSIAATPGSTITYGTPVTFTPTPVNGGAAPVHTWYRNGVSVGAGATYNASDLLPGETVHCSTVSNLPGVISSPSLSNTITMAVTGAPLSDFTAVTLVACPSTGITFTDRSLLTPTSWSWSFPGGTPSSSTAQNPVVSYAAPGIYTVTLTASNGLGTGTTKVQSGYITIYAAPPAACAVSRSTSPAGGIGITNVTLGSINYNSPYNDAVMSDLSCTQRTALSPNTSYTVSATVSSGNNQWVRVYIDYDNNGSFSAGELILSPANGTGVRSGSFTTPASPTLNTLLRMRVITDFVNTTPGACTTTLQYGQVEEFGVVFNSPADVKVAVRAHLDGPYNATTGLMNDGLRSAGLIPATEPYTTLGYSYAGIGAGTVAPAVLAVTGSNAIVDWVVVELRDNIDPSTVVASKAALLQRDGDVVGTDGTSAVSFALGTGTYRVALLHRNHLGAMALNGVPLTATATVVDLTSAGTTTYGIEARKALTGTFPTQALWAGDVNFDHLVIYTGAANDRDLVLARIGGIVPTNSVSGYYAEDVTLDGVVLYTGAANDRDPILTNIGGIVPTNMRSEQLP